MNRQINAELWSAYLYLSMSLYAKSKGLDGVSHWMYLQWLEEQDHARILQEYMLRVDAKVTLMPIDGVPGSWESVYAMFKDALIHEQQVTHMIRRMVKMAYDVDDFSTVSHLQWFIDEQVEEEDSVRSILSALEMLGGDSAAMYEYDKTLLHRQYTKPEPLG